MLTSTHNVAIFEENFMPVDIAPEDVEEYGVEELARSIAEHDYVAALGKRVVVVYDHAQKNPF